MNSGFMQGEKKERWKELCEQAGNQRDPQSCLKWFKRLTDCLPRNRRGLTRTSPRETFNQATARIRTQTSIMNVLVRLQREARSRFPMTWYRFRRRVGWFAVMLALAVLLALFVIRLGDLIGG